MAPFPIFMALPWEASIPHEEIWGTPEIHSTAQRVDYHIMVLALSHLYVKSET